MKTSVGVITYNMESYIRESLMSIISQKDLIDEIVICDDASIDNTVEIASELLENVGGISYKIVKNPKNLGNKLNAMNCYCNECSGDIVIVADPDDIQLPNRFKKIIKEFENPNVCMVFSDASVFFDNEKEHVVPLWKTLGFSYNDVKKQKFYYERITKAFTVSGCTMAFKRDFVAKCFKVPENCSWDMWLGWMAPFYGDIVALEEKLVLYRQHSNNDSHTIRKQNKIKTNRLTRIKKVIEKPIDKYFFDSLYFGKKFLEFINHKINTVNTNEIYEKYLKNAESFYNSILSLSTTSKIERIKTMKELKNCGLYSLYRGNNKQYILDIINLILH